MIKKYVEFDFKISADKLLQLRVAFFWGHSVGKWMSALLSVVFLTGCNGGNDTSNSISGGGGGGDDATLGLIVGGAVVIGGIFALNQYEDSRNQVTDGQLLNSDPIVARRVFAGPNQFDPADYDVYGMVAFPAAPTTGDSLRFVMICEAFMQGISPVSDSASATSNFALTVWPVQDEITDEQLGFRLSEVCINATNLYDARTSREVIDAANRSGKDVEGRGPFLIAWSPGNRFADVTRQIAFIDMSWVNRPTEAAERIREWRKLVVSEPDTWEQRWTTGQFRRLGDEFYALVGPFFE